jgi:hypothetical protein
VRTGEPAATWADAGQAPPCLDAARALVRTICGLLVAAAPASREAPGESGVGKLSIDVPLARRGASRIVRSLLGRDLAAPDDLPDGGSFDATLWRCVPLSAFATSMTGSFGPAQANPSRSRADTGARHGLAGCMASWPSSGLLMQSAPVTPCTLPSPSCRGSLRLLLGSDHEPRSLRQVSPGGCTPSAVVVASLGARSPLSGWARDYASGSSSCSSPTAAFSAYPACHWITLPRYAAA